MSYLPFMILVASGVWGATSLTVNLSTDSNPFTGGTYNPSANQYDLRGTLNYINQNPSDYQIRFAVSNPTIVLHNNSPVLNLNGANTITIDGGSTIEIDENVFRAFSIKQGVVNLQNLNVENLPAAGVEILVEAPAILYSQNVRTSGSLDFEGAGTTYFYGPSTEAQTTVVMGGTLVVNNLLNSPVIVEPNGKLAGDGTITREVSSTGNITPGIPGTTLTLDRVIFGYFSTYVVNINATESSKVVVAGSIGAIIDYGAELVVSQVPATYTVGTLYPAVYNVAGILDGGYIFNVRSLNPNFTFELEPDLTGHTLYVKLASKQIDTADLYGNNREMADYFNRQKNYPPLENIFNSFLFMSPDELTQSLQAISPARNADSTFALQNIAFTFSDLLTMRQDNRRIFGRQKQNTSIWGSAFADFAYQDSQNETPAFHVHSEGLIGGMDWFQFEHWTLGATIGYAHLHIKDSHNFGYQNANDFTASLYSSLGFSSFFLDMTLWGGYNLVSAERQISFPGFEATAKSNWDGWQITPHLGFGYAFHYNQFTLEPFIDLDCAINFERSFTESGAGILSVSQEDQISAMLRSEIGLSGIDRIEFENKALLIFKLDLSYVNKIPFDVGTISASMAGSPDTYTIETLQTIQDFCAPTLEVCYRTPDKFYVKAIYEGEFGSRYMDNLVSIQVGAEF